jgi:hypothetical protein
MNNLKKKRGNKAFYVKTNCSDECLNNKVVGGGVHLKTEVGYSLFKVFQKR